MEPPNKGAANVPGSRLRQIVTFLLAGQEFGVDIMRVQEIIRCQEVAHLPQLPAFIAGVIDLRGKVIPVIDLRQRFETVSTGHTGLTRIIVVNVDAETIGVIVDAVSAVIRLAAEQIEPPPPVVAGIGNQYLLGIGKVAGRLIVLLDLDRLLSAKEKNALTALSG